MRAGLDNGVKLRLVERVYSRLDVPGHPPPAPFAAHYVDEHHCALIPLIPR